MNKLTTGMVLVLMCSLPGWVSAEDAAEPTTAEVGASLPDRDQIYGFDIMTKDERKQYREQYEAIGSDAERKVFLEGHRKRMMERARALGFGTPEQVRPWPAKEASSKGPRRRKGTEDGARHPRLPALLIPPRLMVARRLRAPFFPFFRQEAA